ncbi:MAG: ferredoxin [Silicimonas sp.]|nr:ferredoxin [Silicimonas sp.]
MTLVQIADFARADHLAVLGAFHTDAEDAALGLGTLILLGPDEPGFWHYVTAQTEFTDSTPNPLDRWSHRTITALARRLGGTPYFPFGTPVRPFITWALRSGRAWVSPAQLLVHDTAGLFVSYRGAILVPGELDLPPPPPKPCESCATKPCLTACPADALTANGYDLPACHAFLETKDGKTCMTQGCAVRRACPLARTYPRVDAQSAYHMAQFHK